MVSSPKYRSSSLPDESQYEAIAARAYELWEKSGYAHGHHHEHWHQAEQEIKGLIPEHVTKMGGRHQDEIGHAM